jgi:hypothetical protein
MVIILCNVIYPPDILNLNTCRYMGFFPETFDYFLFNNIIYLIVNKKNLNVLHLNKINHWNNLNLSISFMRMYCSKQVKCIF